MKLFQYNSRRYFIYRFSFFIYIVSFFFIAFALSSCKKETPDTETQSTIDNTICENEFNSRIQLINFLGLNTYKIKSIQTSGPIISSDTINRIITIDYGTIGITDTMDGDNRIRRGIIRATYSNLWHIAGTVAKVELINYSVSNNGGVSFIQYLADSISITRNDSISFVYNIIGGKCISTNYNLLWATNRTVVQTAGYSTKSNISDDIYSSSGKSNGVDRNGKSYSTVITTPIIKKTNCAWIDYGTLDLTPSGLNPRTIDYGNGTCDNKGSLTIDGNTFSFNMN